MIYHKICGYKKCQQPFDSLAVGAVYCKPSHRTLQWMENQKSESQKENNSPEKNTDIMDKNQMREFLKEEKEREETEKLKLKHPELLEQVKKDDALISELKNKIIELEAEIKEYQDERKEEQRKCKEDPEEYYARKLRVHNAYQFQKEKIRKRKSGEVEEAEPEEEVEQENVYLEYRRHNFIGKTIFGGRSWADHHCEIVECKSTDLIHRKQVENDGFVLSSTVIEKDNV